MNFRPPSIKDVVEEHVGQDWAAIDYHFGYYINSDGVVWDTLHNKEVKVSPSGVVRLRNDTLTKYGYQTYTRKSVAMLLRKYFGKD